MRKILCCIDYILAATVCAMWLVIAVLVFRNLVLCDYAEEDGYVEMVKVDADLADKFMLCATRMHRLEQEVDQLRNRIEELEDANIDEEYGNTEQ